MKKTIVVLLACLIVFMTACAGQGKDASVGSKSSPSAASQSEIKGDGSYESYASAESQLTDQSSFDNIDAAYKYLINKTKAETDPDELRYMAYFFKDIDGDGTDEFLLNKGGTVNTIYSYKDQKIVYIDSYDFVTGTIHMFSSDNPKYPGIFCYTCGGSADHYQYMTIKDGKLSVEFLWHDVYGSEPGGYNNRSGVYLTDDTEIIEESKRLYESGNDIKRTSFN